MLQRFFLPILILATGISVPAATLDDFYRSDEFFPVFTWAWADNVPPSYYRELKECGFTIGGYVPLVPGNDYMQALDRMADAGLKAIIFAPGRISNLAFAGLTAETAETAFAALSGELNHHPAVYGYMLRDEPDATLFPGLAKMIEAIRRREPDKLAFVNLFPGYAGAALRADNFRDYLERFVQCCNPAILCFDHYPLNERNIRCDDSYWQDLTDIRDVALRHRKPFWAYVASAGMLIHKPPTRADLSFQVYCAIAYGARGICYFLYQAVPWGNYRGTPIDQFGSRTPTWYDVQYVNRTLANYAPILNHLHSERVYHFGGDGVAVNPPPEERLIESISEDNVLIGEFTHDQNPDHYILLVNKDRELSHQYWSVKWRKEPKEVKAITPWSRNEVDFTGENLWIAPGMPILLHVKF